MNCTETYQRWTELATADSDVAAELKAIALDVEKQEDAFYKELSFGTGGLRGVIGAGTNRMNVYTVAKASQGLADYLNATCANPSVAIGYDSRIKSDLFARTAAAVLAANGIRVYIWPRLMPVPTVSFAVRHLKTDAGIMVTASHNPAKYNGYKVFGADGCQITSQSAKQIQAAISKIDPFDDVYTTSFEDALATGAISYIAKSVYDAFIAAVISRSVAFDDAVSTDASIVYSPLNGTGLHPVCRVLQYAGFTNLTIVPEQREPDGHFPTCPFPNPEVQEALDLAIQLAKQKNAQLVLATDPDCDRVGIALRKPNGSYQLLTGNETGLLLLDFILSQRTKHNAIPVNPVVVKTIVTTDLGEKIAKSYGVSTVNVLTGFKYIGEYIGTLEKKGEAERFLFGFEESYGYLAGDYVRDKDGVIAAFLICQMYGYYAAKGISLLDKLNELYERHGYCLNTLHSFQFEGSRGFTKMEAIMEAFRSPIPQIGGLTVLKCLDYARGIDGLPKSNVLKFLLDGGSSAVVRPSGTEPKLKLYICVNAKSSEQAKTLEQEILKSMNSIIET